MNATDLDEGDTLVNDSEGTQATITHVLDTSIGVDGASYPVEQINKLLKDPAVRRISDD